MAVLKGVSPARVVLAHALPNAIGPIANAVALSPLVSPRRRDHRRDDFQLPGTREPHGRCGDQSRYAAAANLRNDLLCAYLVLVLLADVCAIVSNPKLRNQMSPPPQESTSRSRVAPVVRSARRMAPPAKVDDLAPALIGLALVVFWLLVALFGPLAAPHSVGEIVSYEVFEPMSSQYPLGTDYLGRDMLSRVLLRRAVYRGPGALIAALLASTAGTALGIFAAVSGRWIDEVVSRLLDALICIPSKIFALVMVAAFGSSLPLLLGSPPA